MAVHRGPVTRFPNNANEKGSTSGLDTTGGHQSKDMGSIGTAGSNHGPDNAMITGGNKGGKGAAGGGRGGPGGIKTTGGMGDKK